MIWTLCPTYVVLRRGRSMEKSPSKWKLGADSSIWFQCEHTKWKSAQNKVKRVKWLLPSTPIRKTISYSGGEKKGKNQQNTNHKS